jgi:hypothetical protein
VVGGTDRGSCPMVDFGTNSLKLRVVLLQCFVISTRLLFTVADCQVVHTSSYKHTTAQKRIQLSHLYQSHLVPRKILVIVR